MGIGIMVFKEIMEAYHTAKVESENDGMGANDSAIIAETYMIAINERNSDLISVYFTETGMFGGNTIFGNSGSYIIEMHKGQTPEGEKWFLGSVK